MSRRLFPLFAYSLAAAGAALAAYWLLFTAFMAYDDEGYVLWSLRGYSEAGCLYDRVYTQYGPFFFAFYDVLHRLGLEFTNQTGRWVTLIYWLGSAGLAGWIAWALTQRHLAALAAALLTFTGQQALVREPMHPGGLVTFLVMAAAALGVHALLRNDIRRFALIAGAAGMALALIKINVGVFFLAAAGGWLLLSTWPHRNTAALVAVAGAVFPLALMRSLWPAPWVAQFALAFATGVLALAPALLAANRSQQTSRRDWVVAAVAGFAVAAFALGSIWLRGSSLASIWHGVVVAPLSHPGVYFHPISWQPGAPVLAILGLVLALACSRAARTPQLRSALAVLRLAAAVWFLLGVARAENETLTLFAMNYGAALAWLFAVPLEGEPGSPVNRARLWIGWVFLWQILHAYPVAVSQMAWGTCLFAALVVVGCTESLQLVFRAPHLRRWPALGQLAVAGAGAYSVWRLGAVGCLYFSTSAPLRLPGAEEVRPPPEMGRQLQMLQANAVAHTDVLFTLPGMMSFNIWTQRPTPTWTNVTHWFSLLNPAQQEAIAERLRADPRAGIIIDRGHLDYLASKGFPTDSPLHRFIRENFTPAFSVGNYEFHLKPGRSIEVVNTARFLAPDDANPRARLEVVLGPTAEPVATLGIRPIGDILTDLLLLSPTAAGTWTLTSIRDDGTPSGAAQNPTAPFAVSSLSRLTIEIPSEALAFDTNRIGLSILAPSGRTLTTASFPRDTPAATSEQKRF